MTDPLAQLGSALSEKYQIERPLGSGAMATVYLAMDLRHQRRVALKVLRPDLSAVLGADRFLQEIRVTANLQHPNILPLFDSGTAGNSLFYVMPYADGESLRSRLQREPQLPIDDAVRIASEVASGLEYAHRHGLIHRDIKPENILFHEGRAMVADFGLALAIQTAGGSRLTESGLALGTPQYMSPEQGAGTRILDARTDVYSLGSVTYEMLAGEPPHQGPTAQAIVARVMTEEPRPLSIARPTVPPGLAASVHRALQRSPADRFESADEFAKALASSEVGLTIASEGGRARSSRWSRIAMMLAAAVLVIGGVLLGRATLRAPPQSAARIAFYLETDSTAQLDERYTSPLRISKDGRRIVYAARTPTGSILLIRTLAEREFHVIPGTEGASTPAISPDGDSVAFVAGGALHKTPVSGGLAVTLSRDLGLPDLFNGLDWGPGGTMVYSVGRPTVLFSVSSAGNSPPSRIGTDSSCGWFEPVLLPNGRTILAECASNGGSVLVVVPLSGGPMKRIGIRGASPRYSTGRVFYRVPDGTVQALPYARPGDTVLSRPAAVASAVVYDVSESGTIVQAIEDAVLRLVLVGPDGHERAIVNDDPSHRGELAYPRFSPDGRRLLYEKAGRLWIYSVSAGTEQRIGPEGAGYPAWSPDGKSIVFSSTSEGETDLWSVRADGQGGEQRLFERPLRQSQATTTRDGRWLTFVESAHEADGDIVIVPRTADRQGVTVMRTPSFETQPIVSPDGRWLAYTSDETGAFEIYVQPFRREGERELVSIAGGDGPVWSHDGRRLLYRHGSQVIAAAVSPGERFQITDRRVLFDRPDDLIQVANRHYDVSPDGSTFAFITRSGTRRIAVTTGALSASPH